MTISYAIMAHPKRQAAAEHLAQTLSLSNTAIVWDRDNNEWDTGSRALAAHAGDWHCVLQDDALPIPDFQTHVENAVSNTPARTLISLYTGTLRPLERRVTAAVQTAESIGASWLSYETLLWGVGILLPSEDIPRILAESSHPAYDRRIGNWYRTQQRPVVYTNPSLVDHADTPSLLHDRKGQRHAHHTGPPIWGQEVVGI